VSNVKVTCLDKSRNETTVKQLRMSTYPRW
jgi:hypothetical protein